MVAVAGKITESNSGPTVGIDATNLRLGGGRTHLFELLRAADPAEHGFGKVVVWGARETLDLLDERDWLIKRNPPASEAGLFRRVLWQRFELSRHAREEGCNVLFVPGGSFASDFRPVVTMSRNMLPFEWRELKRFGVSLIALRLLLLRWTQSNSFRAANGVIFLTRYAEEVVKKVTGELNGLTAVIPHGLDHRFIQKPKQQRAIEHFNSSHPYRILYVSVVNQYKHQWHVVEAVGSLRHKTGWSLTLDLVGPAYPPAVARLKKTMNIWDPSGQWVRYHGAVPYAELHQYYRRADLGVFASSCENMPNILLETMAAGLPVVSSNRGPMPEILGESGSYFDPECPAELARSLELMIADPILRARVALSSSASTQGYSWKRCASDTFGMLAKVCRHRE